MRILTFQSGPKKGPINYALTLITGKKYTSKDADGIPSEDHDQAAAVEAV